MATEKQSTLGKTIEILELLATQTQAISIQDVAKQLNLPVTTAHRLLSQLLANRAVERLQNKKFYLANRFINIAINALNNGTAFHQRHLVLEQVSKTTEETCNLSVQNNGKVVYLDRVESNWPHRISLPIGSNLPMCCTASGKIFLAFTTNRHNKLRNLTLEKKTHNTITDKEVFAQELKKIHKQKFSLDNQEFIEGMVAVAVPVFLGGNKSQPIFSLSIHAPIVRKSLDDLYQYIDLLHEAAQDLGDIYNDA